MTSPDPPELAVPVSAGLKPVLPNSAALIERGLRAVLDELYDNWGVDLPLSTRDRDLAFFVEIFQKAAK